MTLIAGLAWAVGLSLIQWPFAIYRGFRSTYRHKIDFDVGGQGKWQPWLIIALSPIAEELLLCKVVRPEAGIWLAATLFGIAHGLGDQPRAIATLKFIGTTCLAVLCGKVWQTTGSWTDALLVHYAWNVIAVATLYLQNLIEHLRGLERLSEINLLPPIRTYNAGLRLPDHEDDQTFLS